MTSPRDKLALQQTLYESRNATRRYLHRRRRDWVMAACAATPAETALEVGIGAGGLFLDLARQAPFVLALDTQHGFLRAARAALQANGARAHFVQGALHRAALAERSFDLIVCSEVIEHIAREHAVIAELARLLKPDGRLVLTTPQPFSPVECLARLAFLPGLRHLVRLIYREPLQPLGHINLYTPARLRREFAAAGLQVRQSQVLGLYLPVIAEFGGQAGQRALAWLERRLCTGPLRWLLWTQCYVLERRPADADSFA